MEALIVAAIVIILLMCMGAGLELIAFLFLVMLDALLLSIFVFFVFCLIRILGGKTAVARFERIDRKPSSKFKTAFYIIDGMEHANVFPAEIIAKKLFYKKSKSKKVCLCKNGDVFDPYSIVTVVYGLILGSSSFVIMLVQIISAVDLH